LESIWALSRATARTLNLWKRIEHDKCPTIVPFVRSSDLNHQRDADAVGNHVSFAAFFGPIRRVWASMDASRQRANASRINHGVSAIDSTRPSQPIQDSQSNLFPQTRFGPFVKSPPAGWPAAAIHLFGKHVPRQSSFQNEDNSRQGLPMRYWRASSFWRGNLQRKQRLNFIPYLVRQQLSHDSTSLEKRRFLTGTGNFTLVAP
jgi:hypothetical protein